TNPTLSTGGARPASFGTATFDLNNAMTAMTFTATIFNIDITGSQTADVNDNLVAAHIHAGPLVTPTRMVLSSGDSSARRLMTTIPMTRSSLLFLRALAARLVASGIYRKAIT